ncbi:MAG: UDP-3-O-(3-hydroxymyristoyl)glucosamine N-acyltransferase [Anaerohalosphaera sp.]|nr:UDP-3-O-(3-hydroxymyristoyl)glucosamine N-acyltransferase [Anaerohalosphaera sp.]
MQGKSLKELAAHVGGTVIGNGEIIISSVSTLENAEPGQITFLSNERYEPMLKTTAASAVIVGHQSECPGSLLVADDPYYAFMQIVVLLHGHRPHKTVGISDKASVAETAILGKNCQVGDFVTISDNAKIGDNCYFYPGVFVGPGVEMGEGCIVYPNAAIYDKTIIGSRVIIHANATIGQDGYGFATHKGVHHKIPQIGKVILEDDVEIGSNAAIERATLEDTVIGKGSKIGDLVAIGHGTRIGPHCLLVPQVGISGSTTLGHHCVLGGQAGVVGHIKIGNMVRVGAKSGVMNSIDDGVTVIGSPAMEAGKAKRVLGSMPGLPDMRKRIKVLERAMARLEKERKV